VVAALLVSITLATWPAAGSGAGAGSGVQAQAPSGGPVKGTAKVKDSLQVKGSDTIGGALGPALARAYMARHGEVAAYWESLGSGTAFVGLFDGSADIGASSRSIRESELDEARRLGITLEEYVLGYDGIAILVHPSNTVPALTLRQISDIFTGTLTNFRQVGGPDRPIMLVSRPSYSGTYGFFEEHVLKLGAKDGAQKFASTTEWIEHSEDVVVRVAAEANAISYLGMGWNLPGVRAVPVRADDASVPVLPSLQTVGVGTYPVFRQLRLYTRGSPSGLVADFLRFVLGEGQRLVTDNGFIPADAPSQLSSASSEEGQDVALRRVFFPAGGSRLDATALETLRSVALEAGDGRVKMLLIGHADATGSVATNARMTLARTRAVAAALRALGIDAARIEVDTRGSEQPIDTNNTAEGRSRNRRVDIRLLPPRG
jgi:phosphate binding protein